MSLLVKSGVPIIESVDILMDSTVNVTYKKALKLLMRALEQGSAISTSLQNNRYFPKMMTQLLFVGQQSGDLAGTTTTLADYYESEVDARLRALSALLEPFIIVILGLAVAFVIISVLQPIYNLTGEF
jgi:type II secretory pathway component PulF